MIRSLLTLLPALLALASCGGTSLSSGPAKAALDVIPAPLALDTTAYEAALATPLPDTEPVERDGLHNVYALSDDIISGAEPESEEAIAAIAAMGVRTVLSVDGKAPDVETAEKYGLRYVHVPIQYSGITDDERLQIAKTFHELEGPFYVHCYHGVHRGPAAAAIGRVTLDGAPRDLAIAEMRQWCGTSKKYEGLYATIAAGDLPSPAETAAYDWDFPSRRELTGMRQSMIHMARSYDRVKAMVETNGAINPEHPDIDPVNEAAILTGLFEQALTMDRVASKPDDFRTWMSESVVQARRLHEVVEADRDGGSADWSASRAAFAELKASCDACHAAYRND